MSLILDALNRSRDDAGEVPGLATRHTYLEPQVPRRPWLLSLALLVAVLVIAWLLWQRGSAPARPTPELAAVQHSERTAAPPSPAVPAAKAREAEAPALEEVMAAQAEGEEATAPAVQPSATQVVAAASGPAPVDQRVAALYRPRPAVQGRPAPSAKPAVAEPALAPVVRPVAAKGSAPARAQAPSGQEEQLDIEALVRQAESELENARLAEHPAPFVSELSQRSKDAIPTIYYQQHDYSGRPGASVVTLNGKSLKPGGTAAPGVKVEEILSDSVVLNHRGTQFRLRALNSWINL